MGCDSSSAESFISYWLKHHLGLSCSLLQYGFKGHFKLANVSYCHPNYSMVDKIKYIGLHNGQVEAPVDMLPGCLFWLPANLSN